MDFNTLKHRFDWFKEEARRLDKISERLACEKQNVEGIHLRMTNAYFRSLSRARSTRCRGARVHRVVPLAPRRHLGCG